MTPDKHIERRIIIGMIVSTEYLTELYKFWDARVLKAPMAQRLASWCIDYFDKYEKAPNRDIEGIYIEHLKKGLPKDIAEDIEEEILPGLSDDYDREKFNHRYLLDQTKQYFRERNLQLFSDQIKGLVDTGELTAAEEAALDYKPMAQELTDVVNLDKTDAIKDDILEAFAESSKPVVTYPGALGGVWNGQMTRGAFVGLLAPEKRGKSYVLLDIAMRGCSQGANVAFFQAGDMTRAQQLRRIGIYLAGKSDKSRYCKQLLVPVLDCGLNFNDSCDRDDRNGSGCVEDLDALKAFDLMKEKAGKNELLDFIKDNEDYKPCGQYKCPAFVGSVWYQIREPVTPLDGSKAHGVLVDFFKPKGKVIKKRRGRFKLSTHSNGTLTVREIKALLDAWEKQENFVPDIILVDYADLMQDDTREFRHKQNEIWKGLRGISQDWHCLLVTATQADAASYEKDTLHLSNFSEDKRKYAHVTAMYGLNQDIKGLEKKLGIIRINELMVREDDGDRAMQVSVLQCLQQGQPHIGSFIKRKPKSNGSDPV